MSERQVRPWDLFNKKMGRTPIDVRDERYKICQSCPFFIKITRQCKKCGCFMKEKVKLSDASCPAGKWGVYNDR